MFALWAYRPCAHLILRIAALGYEIGSQQNHLALVHCVCQLLYTIHIPVASTQRQCTGPVYTCTRIPLHDRATANAGSVSRDRVVSPPAFAHTQGRSCINLAVCVGFFLNLHAGSGKAAHPTQSNPNPGALTPFMQVSLRVTSANQCCQDGVAHDVRKQQHTNNNPCATPEAQERGASDGRVQLTQEPSQPLGTPAATCNRQATTSLEIFSHSSTAMVTLSICPTVLAQKTA